MTAPISYTPGIYRDISNESYHAAEGISKSGLDLIAKSPFLYRYRPPQKPTKAMMIGSAFHCATLEPHIFPEQFAVAPEVNARTNAGKAELELFARANEGKTIIGKDDAERVGAMAKAVRSHQLAAALLSEGEAETSIFHTDEITGELVKVRPDWIVDDLLVDLKSTEDATFEAFSRSCWNYRYYVQAAFYLDVANAAYGRQRFNSFIFIACEKSEPYQVAVYAADRQMIEAGRIQYRRDLEKYHQCRSTDTWPGLNAGRIENITLPGWAMRQIDMAVYD